MIETQARVVAVEPGYAWIESERRSGCSHCTSNDSCGVSSLSKLFSVRQTRLRLPDPLGVHAGDNVVIGLSEQRLVAAAAVAYMLPLFAMIAIALFGARLGYGQGALVLSSFAGLAAGLWLVKNYANARGQSRRFQPLLLRRQAIGESTIEFKPATTGENHE